jgi:hypothetical protein
MVRCNWRGCCYYGKRAAKQERVAATEETLLFLSREAASSCAIIERHESHALMWEPGAMKKEFLL